MNGDYYEYNDYKYRSKNEHSWEPSHKSSISVGAMLKLFVKKCINLQNHTHKSKSVHLIYKIRFICQKVFTLIFKIILICQKVFTLICKII